MRLTPLLLLLLPALVAADCTDEAKAATVAPVISVRAVGTDLWVIWKASVVGADSVQVTATVTGQSAQTKGFAGTTKTDSAKFARPAQGATVTISVTAVAFKFGQKGPTSPARTAAYTEPVVVPVPTIDSLVARPASFRVQQTAPGATPTAVNQQQLCAFVGFHGSGHVGFRRVTEGPITYCDSVYRAFPSAARSVSTSEQASADGVCIRWIATGGTVTPEVCISSPAVRFAPGLRVGVIEVEIVPAPVDVAPPSRERPFIGVGA